VPHPLPPELPVDRKLVLLISKACQALGELSGLGRAIPNPHLLIGPFIRREAVLSSRIEGTQADIADLYAYEAGQLPLPGLKPAPPESDVREVANYVRALEYGMERVKTLPVSLRLLRELHGRLLKDARGEQATPGHFRKTQNWIGPAGCTLNQAPFVPPPVNEMSTALDVFEKYLYGDNEFPPLIRLAFIHYQFEAIHPFIDGNGRIGRLLIVLLLVYWNLLPLPLLYLSDYFNRHRQEYYELLLAVSQQGKWSEWIDFFLEGIAQQSMDATLRAKELQDLQLEWRRRLSKARVSVLSIQIADYLFEKPLVTVPDIQKKLRTTYAAARRHIDKLVEAGILKEVNQTSHPKAYAADKIIGIISNI
jgi:Fic family protein